LGHGLGQETSELVTCLRCALKAFLGRTSRASRRRTP
jgi:hypothetical protein